MESLKILLILAVVLVPLCCLLYYFGIGFTSKACFSVFRSECSLPTLWKGRLEDTSGYMRRNFVILKKHSTLSVEVETASGTFDAKVKAPDGSILSPVSGAYGQNTSLLIDVSPFKRCSVTLQMDHFCGKFHIALQ